MIPWSHLRWYPSHPGIVYNYNPHPGNPRTSCGCMHGHPLGALTCGQYRGAPYDTLFKSVERLYLDGSGRRDTLPLEPRPVGFKYADSVRSPPLHPPIPQPDRFL